MSRHPIFARVFARMTRYEGRRVTNLRARLVEGLEGNVLEVGCGNGMLFAHYPSTVSRVIAIEPEQSLLRAARSRAETSSVSIEVFEGEAEALPIPDASVDAVVFSLVLCSVADPDAAAREARRVLRPGGVVRLYEHTIAPEPGRLATAQRLLDPVWRRMAGGCRLVRDPLASLTRAGFEIESAERFRLRLAPGMPVVDPQVLATLRCPD